MGVVASRHNPYLRFLWVLITTKIFICKVVPWTVFFFFKDHLWDEPFFEREFWDLNFCTHYYIKVRYVVLRMSKHHFISIYKNHTDYKTLWLAKQIYFCKKVVLGFDGDDCHWIALAGPCSLQQHDDLGSLTQQWTSQVTKPILQNGKLRWWSRIAILLYHWYSPLQIWSCLVSEKMKRMKNPLTFPLKKYCGLIVPG